MNETSKKRLNAAIKVFKEKGFVSSSTKLIAKEAGVAEITLYRKFDSKKTLFEQAVRTHLKPSFLDSKLDSTLKTETFFETLLEERLSVMSESSDLMALVIRESLSGNLPEDLNFSTIVFKALKKVLENHKDHHALLMDTEALSRVIVGLLVSYVLLPPQKSFKALSEKEKKALLKTHVDMLMEPINKQGR